MLRPWADTSGTRADTSGTRVDTPTQTPSLVGHVLVSGILEGITCESITIGAEFLES